MCGHVHDSAPLQALNDHLMWLWQVRNSSHVTRAGQVIVPSEAVGSETEGSGGGGEDTWEVI